jgi:hypothetical protein
MEKRGENSNQRDFSFNRKQRPGGSLEVPQVREKEKYLRTP